MTDAATTLSRVMRAELVDRLLPFWTQRVLDHRHGGFIGRMASDGVVAPRADKGVILNTRLLWTYAAAYRVLGNAKCKALADRAYAYVDKHFRDPVHDGVYWMLDYTGHAIDDKKQTYAQAFAIYAYSEYARATGHEAAQAAAVALYRCVERCWDARHGGYLEGFTRTWVPRADMRLSDQDRNVPKGMNTHLHVLEAYTNLYRIWPDAGLQHRLRLLLRLFLDHIIDAQTHHLRSYFALDWAPLDTTVSCGHDIEASWLLYEAAELLDDASLLREVQSRIVTMARATLAEGFDSDGGVLNERDGQGPLDTDKHWWPQAEAIVGCLNAYHLTHDPAFLTQATTTWRFVEQHLLDRTHGEWFWGISQDGTPMLEEDKVGPWKGPYHNMRACLEVMARMMPPR
ncbi:MAG: AGE family epimerase/isomerase [Bacteroidota bacterium]